MAEQLKSYRNKRDFSQTPEPTGQRNAGSAKRRYVMHKHAASHDHFDLRLEHNGVLRSWALPKGPSLKPGEKRLAVEVEDHPLDYGEFEGVIPQDEYGGGTVMLWDKGRWKSTGKVNRNQIDFELHGEKLSGHWTLVRMHGRPSDRNGKNWLLIKRKTPDDEVIRPDDRSVATGRTMRQIAKEESPNGSGNSGDERGHKRNKNRDATRQPSSLDGARRTDMPESVAPQLATLTEKPPAGDDWLHEIKFDGYRLIATLDTGRIRLTTRNGNDWTRRLPQLTRVLEKLPVARAIIDGEIVAVGAQGFPSFAKLQDILGGEKRAAREHELLYQVFDLLYLEGYDIRDAPLLARKDLLADVLGGLTEDAGAIRFSDHVKGQGPEFFAQACELGLEGTVSKKTDAAYRSGRGRSWFKSKCTVHDEFVIGGYTRPSGARTGFGSLLLGAYDNGELIYVGRVGSGFTERQIARLHRKLKTLEIASSPFTGEVPDQAGVRWVEPTLVASVEFTERTQSGVLRHPVYRGLREDMAPQDITIKRPEEDRERGRQPTPHPRNTGEPAVAGVRLTHADRIVFAEQGVTKLDLARYYYDIRDWILPHLAHRPLVLLRCPEGIEQECFFQKHPGQNFANGVPRVPIEEKHDQEAQDFVYVRDVHDLIELVQFNVLELHPWGSRIDRLETPDTLVFDLDPGPHVPWNAIVDTARSLRDWLSELGLTAFLRATGGKGLHLVAPIEPVTSWQGVKQFAHAVAQAHARENPQALTTNMAKAKRKGRIFIDYLRNGRGNTSIAGYSVRALPGAPVATPLRWTELTPVGRADRYSLYTVRRRLSALSEDPWSGFDKVRAPITDAMQERVGMKPTR